MSAIRAQSRTDEGPEREPEEHGEPAGVRRGRHRKPRPRKALLAAGGLALAAGVLSLVRVAPDSGVDARGTAEGESRLDTSGGVTDPAANTAATVTADPTALPSATSVMGGRSLTPTPTGTGGARTEPATATAPSGSTASPGTAPTGPAATSGTPAQPPATTSAPRPAPTTTPAPTHSTADPGPGGLCVPALGLCVDVPGGTGR
jgi:hypothetical protein